jgi:hypothetical protein
MFYGKPLNPFHEAFSMIVGVLLLGRKTQLEWPIASVARSNKMLGGKQVAAH